MAMRGVCTPFWTGWPIMLGTVGCWELFLPSATKLLEWEEIAGSDALCRAIFPVMFLFY